MIESLCWEWSLCSLFSLILLLASIPSLKPIFSPPNSAISLCCCNLDPIVLIMIVLWHRHIFPGHSSLLVDALHGFLATTDMLILQVKANMPKVLIFFARYAIIYDTILISVFMLVYDIEVFYVPFFPFLSASELFTYKLCICI